jgi:hypothetical protein
MLKKLQEKWKVNGWRLLLILVTFAVGGSLTGVAGKKLMNLVNVESAWLYIPIYIIVVTIIWPFAVLAVSIVTGQFPFFLSYLAKMKYRLFRKR